MFKIFHIIGLAVVISLSAVSAKAESVNLKLGVLKFGTVNWELNVLKHHKLDTKHGLDVQVSGFAGKQASSVALQGGAVDSIVTDWLWTSRQRTEGKGFTFIPYSVSVGALMVNADSPIHSIKDLPGRKLGIAGGPLDKSWLLMRALASEKHGLKLDKSVEKVFGAPPLLSQQLEDGKVDAVLTFWHFAAKLEAKGMRRVVDIGQIASDLGIAAQVPQIGYVFNDNWVSSHPGALKKFNTALLEAKAILGKSDQEWERIRPLTKAKDDATFAALKKGYRAGIPSSWGGHERKEAAKLFSILAKIGGAKLVGPGKKIEKGTFAESVTY
ncbi:MAG: ABC transporter substrate-binding protein [Rhodospirillaceae bacterium]|nr:ABC transporter substrate-binding protein [Rhodospirillaceae bacterium]MBL6930328.1 ABC transporter substrate-binding protein [Rhodospirillales bacterium]